MEQYHFNFNEWEEAFKMFYRKRNGYTVTVGGETHTLDVNPKTVLIVSTAADTSGYWIETDRNHAKTDTETKVYRSIKAVKELEAQIRKQSAPSFRRVTPRPAFQPPETCPECLAGVPFDEYGKHEKGA